MLVVLQNGHFVMVEQIEGGQALVRSPLGTNVCYIPAIYQYNIEEEVEEEVEEVVEEETVIEVAPEDDQDFDRVVVEEKP